MLRTHIARATTIPLQFRGLLGTANDERFQQPSRKLHGGVFTQVSGVLLNKPARDSTGRDARPLVARRIRAEMPG